VVFLFDWRQRAPQVTRRIALGPAGRDGISKHPAADLQGAVPSLPSASTRRMHASNSGALICAIGIDPIQGNTQSSSRQKTLLE
jgi:hypothetical protein